MLPSRPQPGWPFRKEPAPFHFVLSNRDRADSKTKRSAALIGSSVCRSVSAARLPHNQFRFCERNIVHCLAFGARHSSSSARAPHLEIAKATRQRLFRADETVRSTTTLSISKGEDHENVESNTVDGCYRTWTSRNSKRGQGGMLLFRWLLCLVFRL